MLEFILYMLGVMAIIGMTIVTVTWYNWTLHQAMQFGAVDTVLWLSVGSAFSLIAGQLTIWSALCADGAAVGYFVAIFRFGKPGFWIICSNLHNFPENPPINDGDPPETEEPDHSQPETGEPCTAAAGPDVWSIQGSEWSTPKHFTRKYQDD